MSMKIKDMNEFLMHFDEIENAVCKSFYLQQFSDIGEGNFASFCGKHIHFPFSSFKENENEKKIIPLHEIKRERPLERSTLSQCVEEIQKASYLQNLYENNIQF